MNTDAHAVDAKPPMPTQIDAVTLRLMLEAGIDILRPAIRDSRKRPVERATAFGIAFGHLSALHLAKLIDKAEHDRRRAELDADIAK